MGTSLSPTRTGGFGVDMFKCDLGIRPDLMLEYIEAEAGAMIENDEATSDSLAPRRLPRLPTPSRPRTRLPKASSRFSPWRDSIVRRSMVPP